MDYDTAYAGDLSFEAVGAMCVAHGEKLVRDYRADRKPVDPRDPDYSRVGLFIHHNCYRCHSGELPCVQGHPNRCEFPHARND